VIIGKKSFPADHLVANVEAFLEFIKSLKHTSVKGTYLGKATISSTMSPGIGLAVGG
jgi:large subunit ribosomal protein L1